MAEKHEATTLVLGKTKGKLVRFSYLHAFRPHKSKEGKRHQYGLEIMIPKANVEDEKAVRDAIKAQQDILWPEGVKAPKHWKPLRDGDTNVDQKGNPKPVPGYWLLSANTDAFPRNKDDGNEIISDKPLPAPEVAGTTRNAEGKLELLTESQVKSGDWGRVSINVKSYKTGDTGVSAYLNSLQKVQTGEPLGNGRRSAASEFDDYDDTDESDPLS